MIKIAYLSMILLFSAALSAESYTSSLGSANLEYLAAQFQKSSEITIKVMNHPKLGQILTDGRGLAVYTFSSDKSNSSACYDQCAISWPPVLTSGQPILEPGIEGRVDTIKRNDSTLQVTYNSMPLYYFGQDKRAGEVHGQNVENKWSVVTPFSFPDKHNQQ